MKRLHTNFLDFFNYVRYHFFGVRIIQGSPIGYRIWALNRIFKVIFLGRKKSENYLYPNDIMVRNKFGNFFVPSNSDMILTLSTKFEFDLIHHFKVMPNAIFLDIGANAGKYSILVSNNSKNSVVYSFEPSPSTFNNLKTNIHLNNLQNVKALNIGLSDYEGNLQFANSKTKTGLSHVVQQGEKTDFNSYEIATVNVSTLDLVIKNYNIDSSKIDLIKIDVEGHEFHVLKGAKHTLKVVLPMTRILIEVNKETSDSSPIIEFVRDLGFSVKRLNDEYFLFTKS